jgi:hypothetical protein
MQNETITSKDGSSRISVRMLVYIAIAWGMLVSGVLTWQAYTYRGVFGAMAEWQFRAWDQMFPVATIGLTTLLLELPLLLIIFFRLRARRRTLGPIRLKTVIERESLGVRVLTILSGIALLIAAILVVLGFMTSGVAEKPAGITSLANASAGSGEFVRTRGLVRLDRIGYYRERFVFVGRDLWVAPVTSGDEDRMITLFVEVKPTQKPREPETREVSGITRAAAVPGGLRKLYEYEGYSVSTEAHVVFASRASARWPYFSAAGDIALGALLALLLALGLRWHLGRLRKQHDTA